MISAWAGNRLSFGENLMIGYETVLQTDSPLQRYVNTVMFNSPSGGAIWKIRHNVGK